MVILNNHPQKVSLNDKLCSWYLKHGLTRQCAQDLQITLNKENLNVSSLLRSTLTTKPIIEQVAGGSYMHIGLTTIIHKLSLVVKLPDSLNIDINIDGLPLYKGSRTQLWLISVRCNNIKCISCRRFCGYK